MTRPTGVPVLQIVDYAVTLVDSLAAVRIVGYITVKTPYKSTRYTRVPAGRHDGWVGAQSHPVTKFSWTL